MEVILYNLNIFQQIIHQNQFQTRLIGSQSDYNFNMTNLIFAKQATRIVLMFYSTKSSYYNPTYPSTLIFFLIISLTPPLTINKEIDNGEMSSNFL